MSKLIISNLTVQYSSKVILDDLSFTLEQGQFACLCGPNGSGKSTLISAVSGVEGSALKLTKGTVLLAHTDLASTGISQKKLAKVTKGTDPSDTIHFLKLSPMEKARILAVMQQNESSVWNFSVKDYVLQGRFAHSNGGHYSSEDYEIVASTLKEMELETFADRTVHTLSGGEFQKVRIARALVQQPMFLFLDEPAANLDYVYEPQLLAFLKKIAVSKNIGILISIHDINLAWKNADSIMLINKQKKLISGAPDDIMTVENLKSSFGVNFECKETKLFQSLQ